LSEELKRPPPIAKCQPLPVGLFLCGVLRKYGGFSGNLRSSLPCPVARSRPPSTLSKAFFSPPRQRQNLEVRKHRKCGHYESMAYSRAFQAVGWDHCLAGGNHQPAVYPSAQTKRRCSFCVLDTPDYALCGRLSGLVLPAPAGSIVTSSRPAMSHL
jgi:hypothetical protein